MRRELEDLIVASGFYRFGFSEIWLMDDGLKYTSRQDRRAPAEKIGFWQRERKRRPYWGFVRDFLA